MSKEAGSKFSFPSVLSYVIFSPRICLFLIVTLLGVQVKILYAGWRRDGTWPDSTTVVDEDNFFGTTGPEAAS